MRPNKSRRDYSGIDCRLDNLLTGTSDIGSINKLFQTFESEE